MIGKASTLVALSAALLASAAQADVNISGKVTQNMSCSGGVCTPTASKAVLNVTDLANMLASGDVTVNTGRSLAQNIDVSAALSWTSTSRLTLDAFQSITVKKPVSVTGTGALTVTTNDGGSGGDLLFVDKGHVTFWGLSSSLIVNGSSYTLVKKLKGLRDAIKANPAGLFALADSYNAQKDGVYAKSPISLVSGAIEGLGNVISNFSVNDPDRRGVDGLVSQNEGLIRDLGLVNASVTGGGAKHRVGGMVGSNASGGLIQNCYVIGTLSSSFWAGGLVGDNSGTVVHSYATATISGDTAGGLIGINSGLVETSHATGAVPVGFDVGGLVGDNEGTISQSYATGAVGTDVNGTIVPGGLVGQDGDARKNQLIDGTIEDSYAIGAVAGIYEGGLIGYKVYGTISNSYSIGAVQPGARERGGLIGEDDGGSNADTYWDLDTSGVSDPSQGAGNVANDPGITGLTDMQLKSGLPEGFDPKIWAQDPKRNNGYPYLKANPPPN